MLATLLLFAAEEGQKAPNPILPAKNEIFWGFGAFLVLFILMAKFAYPGVQKAMRERTERIRNNLDDAERVKTEAQGILEEYQRQLADARGEANRIIEEARLTADQMRKDLMQRAEAEVNDLKQRTSEDIAAARDRAIGDLREAVGSIAVELAEKVVERNLDRQTQQALVDSYIDQLAAR